MENKNKTNTASTGQTAVDTATLNATKHYYSLCDGTLVVQTTRTLKSKSLQSDFEKIGEAYEIDPKPKKLNYWQAVEKSAIPYAGTHCLWDMEKLCLTDIND